MATKKRAGLGRGLGALIPQGPTEPRDRAIDVFFDGSAPTGRSEKTATKESTSIDSNPSPKDRESTGIDVNGVPATANRRGSTGAGAGNGASASTDSDSVDDTEQPTSRKRKPTSTRGKSAKAARRGADDSAMAVSDTTRAAEDVATSEVPEATRAGATDGKTSDTYSHVDVTTDVAADSADADAVDDAGAAAPEAAVTAPTAVSSVTDATDATDVTDASGASAADATGELDDESLLPIPGASLRTLDPMTIVPNAWQPRHEFDEEALDELIVSVREFGVLQPIVVRPLPEGDPRRSLGEYELIMGERRLRATKASGRTEIPAIIRHTDDEDMLRDALLENLHRADLNPIEEASAYRQLLDDFGCTQDVLAERIGRSRPRISNTLRLLNLPMDVQRKVAAGVLSAGHARAVLSLGEPAAMQQLSDKIINEELSVREAEAAAARHGSRAGRRETSTTAGSNSISGYLDEVGERLGDRLNTRVKVTLRKTKGQITVEFASVADLKRILEELGETGE